METVAYIVIAVLLAFGPPVGFFVGMKLSAALFGINLHLGDTLRVKEWPPRDLEDVDDLPEIYRPQPAEDDAGEGAPAEDTLEPDPAADAEDADITEAAGAPRPSCEAGEDDAANKTDHA